MFAGKLLLLLLLRRRARTGRWRSTARKSHLAQTLHKYTYTHTEQIHKRTYTSAQVSDRAKPCERANLRIDNLAEVRSFLSVFASYLFHLKREQEEMEEEVKNTKRRLRLVSGQTHAYTYTLKYG